MNRLNLNDVTFLIPVRIDSEDRHCNLSIVVQYLNKYLDTNVLILEADSNTKIKDIQLPIGYKKFYIQDDNKLFHRTKYNNQLITLATTPIIALYDTDIVIPIEQIYRAILEIRHVGADFVSPYEGEMRSVGYTFKKTFEINLDLQLFQNNKAEFGVVSRRSYGGAVFLKRESFIDAGMENENFSSWGPEDFERKKRMEILGYKIKRIEGSVFHLPHERNINSTYTDLNTRIKFMKEYFRISSMKTNELKMFISDQYWVKKMKNEY